MLEPILWSLWGLGAFVSCQLFAIEENRKNGWDGANKVCNHIFMLMFFPLWLMWPFCIVEQISEERKHWRELRPERGYKKIWNAYDRYLAEVDMMEAWYHALDGEAPPHPYPLEYPDVPDPRTEKERAKIPKVTLYQAIDLIDTANKRKYKIAEEKRWRDRYKRVDENPPVPEIYTEQERELDLFGVRSTDELIERLDKELAPPPPPPTGPYSSAVERAYDGVCAICNVPRYTEVIEEYSGTGEMTRWFTQATPCDCPRRRKMNDSLGYM